MARCFCLPALSDCSGIWRVFGMPIEYRDNVIPGAEEAIDLYKRSTLGLRRPVDRPDIFEGMLRGANLVLTAWDGALLVGISRCLTDFTYVTYLANLAVDATYQR